MGNLRNKMNETVKLQKEKKKKSMFSELANTSNRAGSAMKSRYVSPLSGNGNWNAELSQRIAKQGSVQKKRLLDESSVPENDLLSFSIEVPRKKRKVTAEPCASSTPMIPEVSIDLTERNPRMPTRKRKRNPMFKAILDGFVETAVSKSSRAKRLAALREDASAKNSIIDLTNKSRCSPKVHRKKERMLMHCSSYVSANASSTIEIEDEKITNIVPEKKERPSMHCSSYVSTSVIDLVEDSLDVDSNISSRPKPDNKAKPEAMIDNETILIDDSIVEIEPNTSMTSTVTKPHNVKDNVLSKESPIELVVLDVTTSCALKAATCTVTRDPADDISIIASRECSKPKEDSLDSEVTIICQTMKRKVLPFIAKNPTNDPMNTEWWEKWWEHKDHPVSKVVKTSPNKPSTKSNSQAVCTKSRAMHVPTPAPWTAYGNNFSTPPSVPTRGLRPIVIDGSNVAMSHGKSSYFSSYGIKIVVDFFLKKNHKVYAFVPLFRRSHGETRNPEIMDKMEDEGSLIYTPSRFLDGRRITPYDDRYIVQTAATLGGVIVSKDNYRDLLSENPNYAEVIKNRLLMFTFVGDMVMFPPDPMGAYGPSLDRMLSF